MDGDSQGGNGRSNSSTDLSVNVSGASQFVESRRLNYSRAGFEIPSRKLILDATRLWFLIQEGWKFVIDEDGVILAYLTPELDHRLAALTDRAHVVRKTRSDKRRGLKRS